MRIIQRERKAHGIKIESAMNNRRTITLIIMICISSCAVEESAIEQIPGTGVIYAGWEESDDGTKTSLESGRKVVWNKGDKIAYMSINVNNSTDSDYYVGSTYTLEDQYDGRSVGVFKGLTRFYNESYFGFCVYPGGDYNYRNCRAHVEKGKVMLYNRVVGRQKLLEGSFEKKANISVGKEVHF